jgi:hypothetical protein
VYLNLASRLLSFSVVIANDEYIPYTFVANNVTSQEGTGFIDAGSSVETDTKQSAIAGLGKTLIK